ncbi:S-adenosyl-L-methionine-dependent methyltransferase [Glomus cerebriforme]|uniref:S-adenosyl-L-methionine-dependent methyltransferase n=1 Tax=Glomus cerebriforme TaxID=658196 RepID=A0A397SV98_9GLOM|nr:S-adenosyl-L-methionine-dependent methyltransferase [Glomus cerebriforme]
MGHFNSKNNLSPNNNNKNSHKSSSISKKNSFRYVNGRRFHNNENSRYFLPNDEEEVDRLQLEHFLFRCIWDDNFSSPIKDLIEQGDANVLDVGCGPGTWLLDMSTNYPRSSFTGVDMSPIYPDDIKPRNLTFHMANVLEGLPFADNSFDFVYMRFMMTSFTEDDWQNKVVKELIRVCKPDGWVEFMEGDLIFNPEGPAGKRLMDAYRTMLESKQINPRITNHLYSILSSTQEITCLTSKEKPGPIGNWGGRIGELSYQNFSQTLCALKPTLSKEMECTNEEYDELIEEFGRECNLNMTNFVHFRFFAKKVE